MTSGLGTMTRFEQTKTGAGAAPLFALKWLVNACDANACAYKAEKKKQKYNPRQRPTAAWEGWQHPQGKRFDIQRNTRLRKQAGKEGSKQSSKSASKRAREQASNRASPQASQQASKQTSKQAKQSKAKQGKAKQSKSKAKQSKASKAKQAKQSKEGSKQERKKAGKQESGYSSKRTSQQASRKADNILWTRPICPPASWIACKHGYQFRALFFFAWAKIVCRVKNLIWKTKHKKIRHRRGESHDISRKPWK